MLFMYLLFLYPSELAIYSVEIQLYTAYKSKARNDFPFYPVFFLYPPFN